MYPKTIDGTTYIVYTPEEHKQAMVYKKLCQETKKVLDKISQIQEG